MDIRIYYIKFNIVYSNVFFILSEKKGEFNMNETNENMQKGYKKILSFLESNGIQYVENHAFRDLTDNEGGYLVYDFAIYHPKRNILLGLIDHTEKFYSNSSIFSNVIGVGYDQLDEEDKLKNSYCADRGIQLEQLTYNQDENLEELLDIFISHIDGSLYMGEFRSIKNMKK